MARTRLYRGGTVVAEDFPVADISEHVQLSGATVWLDICDPEASDLAAISEELGLHELAVEDAVHGSQRPKLARFDTHLFLTAHATALDSSTGQLATHEVAVFVTRNALVTVRQGDGFDIDDVVSRWDGSPDLAGHGVGYLLHGLLDHVVDTHFATVQELDEQIERLEDLLFDDRPQNAQVQRRSFQLRKSLVLLRRSVLPMRELVNSLMRRDTHTLDDAMLPYFQDVYDHVLRASEWTESLRDLVGTVLETNLTIQGNQLNGIMKKLTGWAAVIAVPTAVTGFYGQNVPYPGFAHWSGFVVSTVLTVGLSVALYVMLRSRDWI
jgi:magnesium transporter